MFESAAVNNLGFKVSQSSDVRPDAFLFGESQSRVVVSVSKESNVAFENFMLSKNVPFVMAGEVTNGGIEINGQNWGAIGFWKELYDTAIEKHLNHYLPE